MPEAAEKEPSAHGVHAVGALEPAIGLKKPGAQGVQTLEPAALEKKPAAHAKQAAEEELPALGL